MRGRPTCSRDEMLHRLDPTSGQISAIALAASAIIVAEMPGGRRGRPKAASVALRQAVITLFTRGGLSVRDISAIMERSGVAAPFGGVHWHPSTVGRILDEADLRAPRGRRPSLRVLLPTPASGTPLHRLLRIAWRKRHPGSGSDLWTMLEREGKLDPDVRFTL